MFRQREKTAVVLMLAFVAGIFLSCSYAQSGKTTKEERKVAKFREIKASSAINLVLTQSNTQKVEIEANENFLEEIITEVIDGELIIRIDPSTIRSRGDYGKVYVSMTDLEDLNVSGACKVTSTNTLKNSKLDIDASGASSIDITVNIGDLDINAAGASKIVVKGTARKASYDVKGATKLSAFDCKASHVEVEASGASKAEIFASNTLSIEVAGASTIRYKGSPKITKQEITGASSVKPVK